MNYRPNKYQNSKLCKHIKFLEELMIGFKLKLYFSNYIKSSLVGIKKCIMISYQIDDLKFEHIY